MGKMSILLDKELGCLKVLSSSLFLACWRRKADIIPSKTKKIGKIMLLMLSSIDKRDSVQNPEKEKLNT